MEFLKSFPKTAWAEHIKAHRPVIAFQDKKEEKAYLKANLLEVKSLLKTGRVGKALDFISLSLYIDKEFFLENLKKVAILRHSSYLNSRNPVSGIAKNILLYEDLFSLTASEINYFNSLVNFEVIYKELNRINCAINKEIFSRFRIPKTKTIGTRKFELSKLKALLAINEGNFLALKDGNRAVLDLNDYEFYSKEEISEAISFLVSKFNESIGFQKSDLLLVDSEYASHDASNQLITLACKFKAIKELEIEIEVYGYTCSLDQNKIATISHPDENFLKSIELSNIQYELQAQTNVYYSHAFNKDAASMVDVAKAFHENFPDLFQLKTEPFERYVLSIPPSLITMLLSTKKLALFREEINVIRNIANELLIPYTSLENYEIRENFTYFDFVKLLRFFTLQYYILSNKLRQILGKVDDELIYRSIVAVFSKDDLKLYLGLISSKEKVDTFLALLTWDTADKKKYLDLQYTPIILHEDKYLTSSCLIGMSNLTRNIFLSESKAGNNFKALQIPNHTPIAEMLKESFSKHSFAMLTEVPIRHNSSTQKESDIDFLAYKDGLLFIAECKDAIHPIDVFEMRTTYSHFQKASSQLSYIMQALKDKKVLKGLCERMQINETDVDVIVPVIVASNNKFWGYSFEGFPVRNVKELSAFVSTGYWNFRLTEEKMSRYHLWKGRVFDITDLINFCNKDGPHASFYQSCKMITYKFTDKIHKKSFSLTLEKLEENLRATFPFELVEIPEVG
ncbi:MAG TPA: hypothetical protein VLC98_10220 [Phnomibacter sp.]|nr:hypothetical protein [Phnomibacter sp.]